MTLGRPTCASTMIRISAPNAQQIASRNDMLNTWKSRSRRRLPRAPLALAVALAVLLPVVPLGRPVMASPSTAP
jgi:hypothetical protein